LDKAKCITSQDYAGTLKKQSNLITVYFQQEQVLSELYQHTHLEPPPADKASTSETLEYLQACNRLFEAGFLSHDKITSLDSPVLQSIDKGYEYFTSWLSTLLTEGSFKQ